MTEYDALLILLALVPVGFAVYYTYDWMRYKLACRRNATMAPWQRRAAMEGQGCGFEVLPPRDAQ